ncbi:hypothetical protein C8R45DRAFT_985066 [Mycena sanguinolenta]|nr:hypothetical protein C8R45DRAFT_985066 [Mycena sanguinolenta]
MSFFSALLCLVLASFAPEASAIIVHHSTGSGLSTTARIIIVVGTPSLSSDCGSFLPYCSKLCLDIFSPSWLSIRRSLFDQILIAHPVFLVIFFLLLALHFARVRRNRRAAQAAAPNIPVIVSQVQPNASGYNYPVSPQYPPPQGYGPQPGYYGQPYIPGGAGADPGKAYGNYSPPVGMPNTNAQGMLYAPPPGPPPSGYDATSPLAYVPPAHTTGEDHYGYRTQ